MTLTSHEESTKKTSGCRYLRTSSLQLSKAVENVWPGDVEEERTTLEYGNIKKIECQVRSVYHKRNATEIDH